MEPAAGVWKYSEFDATTNTCKADQVASNGNGTFVLARNADGSWSYTIPAAIPATYLAPYNDTASFTDGELTGQALLDGTYTVGFQAYKNYTVEGEPVRDVGNAVEDFLFGASPMPAPREVVKTDNCRSCHVRLEAHGGSRQDARLCVLCAVRVQHARSTSSAFSLFGARNVPRRYTCDGLGHVPSFPGVTPGRPNADCRRTDAVAGDARPARPPHARLGAAARIRGRSLDPRHE